MHSAALQGYYPWTSRNQGHQRARKHTDRTHGTTKEGVLKRKNNPHPHTPKKNDMIEKWVLIKSSKFSPHFSTFLACYGMFLYVWFHPTTPFFTLRDVFLFFRQSIHTATGRPCQKSPANQDQRTPRLPGRKAASSYTSVHVSSSEEHPQTVHEFYHGMLRERGTSLKLHRYIPFFFLISQGFVLHNIHRHHMVTGIILQALEPSCKKQNMVDVRVTPAPKVKNSSVISTNLRNTSHIGSFRQVKLFLKH